MNSRDLDRSLPGLFGELINGPSETGAYMLNPGDAGLLASLDRLSSDDASATPTGGASVAAHAGHLAYGLSLMNRWANGENPFVDADWTKAWETSRVSPKEWDAIRSELRRECTAWQANLAQDRSIEGIELDAVIGSIAHLAYHLGAMRQIARALRGPAATAAS